MAETVKHEPVGTSSSFNDWFLSLPEGRRKVLRDDKWMLAEASYHAGRENFSDLLRALHTVRANLIRLAWEENTLMIEGIDAAIAKAEGRS